MINNAHPVHQQPVYNILTQVDSFPYYPTVPINGIAIVNEGASTLTVVINDGQKDITVNCTTTSRNYDAYFDKVASINVTSGTNYQIELRKGA